MATSIQPMDDEHLNLFYSYNKDEDAELIENNLTRAFIQTLRVMSGATRTSLLRMLDKKKLARHDFADAWFALQRRVANACDCEYKYIVTIADEREGQGTEDLSEKEAESVPDAWIFDGPGCKNYCLLIECKCRGYPLRLGQVLNHAQNFFTEKQSREVLKTWYSEHSITLTWYDVLDAIEATLREAPQPNKQEQHCLHEFESFLAIYGYRLFGGFHLSELEDKQPPHDWRLHSANREKAQ